MRTTFISYKIEVGMLSVNPIASATTDEGSLILGTGEVLQDHKYQVPKLDVNINGQFYLPIEDYTGLIFLQILFIKLEGKEQKSCLE